MKVTRFNGCFVLFFLSIEPLWAKINLTGLVLSEIERKPVELGTLIVLEPKIKVRFKDGVYSVVLPEAGTYTFRINSPGFARFQKKITIDKSQKLDFFLSSATIRTQSLKVRGRKNIQTLSRNTLSQQELKTAPATFGDSISALTTLPGVIRSTPGGIFGSLIIRGANEFDNRYYIDDIPVLYPQHFGALQSVISNELIGRIDLYSSSSPVYYGQSLGGVIDIRTKDTVKDLNSKIIFGLISSDVYFENVIKDFQNKQRKKNQKKKINEGQAQAKGPSAVLTPSQTEPASSRKAKNRGYWTASGRVSYLTLILGPILQSLDTGRASFQLPQYYDYQLKGRYFLDDQSKHSVRLLFFGFYDTFSFLNRMPTEEEANEQEPDDDPLFANASSEIRNQILSNNLGLYYRYRPSKKLDNQLTVFSAWNRSEFFADVSTVSERNIDVEH